MNVMEGQGRTVMCGVVVVVACRIIVSAPVPGSFLWTLDFGFGTELGLDKKSMLKEEKILKIFIYQIPQFSASRFLLTMFSLFSE